MTTPAFRGIRGYYNVGMTTFRSHTSDGRWQRLHPRKIKWKVW
jgi:hypothetical protein